jgi:hypothetical protein
MKYAASKYRLKLADCMMLFPEDRTIHRDWRVALASYRGMNAPRWNRTYIAQRPFTELLICDYGVRNFKYFRIHSHIILAGEVGQLGDNFVVGPMNSWQYLAVIEIVT